MNPLISVIIPTYNEAGRIARAVNSMQNQTYKNLEIIVVDDNSSDNTRDIVENIQKKDYRVQYHIFKGNEPKTNWRGYDINSGYAARNYGFKLAKGDWITTQDADDASLLNRIETQYKLAVEYNATLVTVQWHQLTADIINKKLDVERIIADKGKKSIIIKPDVIASMAKQNKGPMMMEPFHRFIPFTIKWFPYARKLFYKRLDCYPGADNSMLFDRCVLDDGIFFRKRNERTWGVPSGRGSGRDFAFRTAYIYKNSWSFKLPMYLWNVKLQNPDYSGYEKYII